MNRSDCSCIGVGTGSDLQSNEEDPVILFDCVSSALSAVKSADTDATRWLERIGGIEERLAELEAKTAPLVADLEARVIDIIKFQLRRKDHMSEGEAPSWEELSVRDSSEFAEAKEQPEFRKSRVMTHKDTEVISRHTQDYQMSDSVWEAALLAWTPASGVLGSVFFSLLIAFNIYIQVVFCSIAWSVFATDEESIFHSKIEEQAKVWRSFEAHSTDRMNKASWTSFATRVCQLDDTLVLGNKQVALLSELKRYADALLVCGFGVGKTGPVLTVLCLILWYFTVAKEILNSFDVVNVLCSIPHAGIHSRIVMDVENKIAVEALGWPRRVCLLLLACVRLVIAVWLLLSGGRWLCLTTNVFDLILNAASLAFVLDCDELIYAAMAPPDLRRSMKNLAPLKHKKDLTFRGLGMKGPLTLFMLIVFLHSLHRGLIEPILLRMNVVNATMCEGEQAFVVEASGILGHAVVVPTIPSILNASFDSLLKRATIEVTDMTNEEMVRLAELPMRLQNKTAMIVHSMGDFDTELRKTFSNFLSPKCGDELHLSSAELIVQQPYLESLRFSTGRLDANKCADFEDLCRSHRSEGTLVRSLCSETCSCGSVLGFMVNRRGCSVACNAKTQVELSMFSKEFSRDAVSACIDKPQEMFLDTKVELMLEEYEKLLGVKLPVEKIQEFGCLAFFSPNFEHIFGRVNGEWVPDALCGRVIGSNIASKNMQYQSMRWLCPVSCGCSIDFSSDCPRSCRQGPYVYQDDPCVLGICRRKTVRNASIAPGLSCQDVDDRLRNHTYPQHYCEAMVETVADTCCCSDARSCDPCFHCAKAEACFGDGPCAFCGASEECRGTYCEGCRNVAHCAPCFRQE